MLRKALFSFAAIVAALSMALPTHAATPLNWTDISDQLTVRTNRPVWAMTYANGNWFYTDGQDLWNGGQVYRYDGSTQVNITTDVRNAGISRVDDIVTDGTNVIFFKDIFRLDNAVEAVRYRDGSYSNITSLIRSSLDSNEGISSIVGRNGTWMMVSTRARVVRFSGTFSSYSRIAAPAEMKTLSASDATLLYSAHNRMDRGTYATSFSGIALAPIGNGFLLVVGRAFQASSNSVANFYRVDNDVVTRISGPALYGGMFALDVRGIVSNGTTVLIITQSPYGHGWDGAIFFFNGSSWVKSSDSWLCIDPGACSSNHFEDASTFSATWDGSQWLFLSGKKLYRFDSVQQLVQVGTVRDYFITAASNGNGTTLFGGAVSYDGLNAPSTPLTAKLVKVTEGAGTNNTNTTNNAAQTANGISTWTWIDPNQTTIRRDQNVNFNVGAWSAKGLSKIEVVVNGIVRRTCELGGATGNQSCAYPLWGGEYNLGTVVSFNAKVTDSQGAISWTQLQSLYVTAADGTVTTNTSVTNKAPTTWSWAIPGDSNLVSNMATYHVGAWDGDTGVSRIEIWVNGTVRRTCTYPAVKTNVECSWEVFASDFNLWSEVYMNARVVDGAGAVTWAASKSWRVVPNSVNQNGMSPLANPTVTYPTPDDTLNLPGSVSITSNRDAGYKNNQFITYTASAADQNGIDRIELYVNGTRVKTCYNTATCVWTGGTYNSRNFVNYGATIVDKGGYALWTGYKTIKKI